MKIGINVSSAVSETPTGVGNYIINLVKNLTAQDKKNQYYLYFRRKIKNKIIYNFNLPLIKLEPHFSWLFYNKIDLFYDPSCKYIRIGKSKNIIFVHDVIVALKEDYTSEKFKKKQYSKLLKALDRPDKEGYGGKEIREFIKESPVCGKIIEPGFVPTDELRLFYWKAELFLFPSYYEGFGLPVLEALACGCPVVCSNVSSIPEVGGDAVMYVDPFQKDDIAEKALYLINNPKLKKELIKKGLAHIKNFTWAKTAQKTLEVYEDLTS